MKTGISKALLLHVTLGLVLLFPPLVRSQASSAKSAVEVQVVDEANKPVEGATVMLMGALGQHLAGEAATDRKGSVVFSNLSGTRYSVGVKSPKNRDLFDPAAADDSYATEEMVVRTEPGKVTRVVRKLSPGGKIEIAILRGAAPLPLQECDGCSVLPYREGGPLAEPEISNGLLVCRGLPPGSDYEVHFESHGFTFQRVGHVTVSAGSTTKVSFQYDLSNPTGVEGTFRTSDGTPLENVFILARREGSPEEGGHDKTDAEGRFRIVGLEPGTYRVHPWSPGVEKTVSVMQGAITAVELVFEKDEAASHPLKLVLGDGNGDRKEAPLSSTVTRAGAPSAPTEWPWRTAPVIYNVNPKDQKNPRRKLERDDPMYQDVLPGIIEGIQKGIECLKNNPGTPGWARSFESQVAPTGFFQSLFSPPALNFAVNYPPPKPGVCGGATPGVMQPVLIWFTPGTPEGECGCFPSVVFHELLHRCCTGLSECSNYRCAKECFPCAEDVPSQIETEGGVKEDCSQTPTCCEPKK